jgi:glycosyltransferase involved in cell wall biosynthesis
MQPSPDRPKVSKEPVSVLIPFHNQATGLETIVDGWQRALGRLGGPYELAIIDDGSTDGSAAIAGRLAARHVEVRVFTHESRRGYGACVKTGLSEVQFPLVLLTSCDFPYMPGDIAKLLDVIDTVDLVTGCRKNAVPHWLRRWDATYHFFLRIIFGVHLDPRPGWMGWAAWWQSVKYRMLFGIRTWDPTCAFVLYRRLVLERIPIQSDGDFSRVELLAKANFLGCLLAEVAIGRLSGNFKGSPEPPFGSDLRDAMTLFRRPLFSATQRPDPEGG